MGFVEKFKIGARVGQKFWNPNKVSNKLFKEQKKLDKKEAKASKKNK